MLLRDQLTSGDLSKFAEVATEVLTHTDPLRELTGEDLFSARINGEKARYSLRLKRGVATTLALAGSLPPDPLSGGAQTPELAERVTSRLLRSALDDQTHRTWLALVEVLPLLSEAAPEAILYALRSCLAGDHAFTQAMFADRSVVGIDFGPPSPHYRVLNALEVIAWSPDHLTAVADLLARLDALSAETRNSTQSFGRDLNRPFERLAAILCAWLPYTSADAEARRATVQMLRRNYADIAWRLMLSMLPSGLDTQTPGALPQFRDWRPAQPVVTLAERADVTTAVATSLIEDAGNDAQRWRGLIQHIGRLRGTVLAQAISALGEIAAAGADEPFRVAVWSALRKLVEVHRRSRDAHWTFPEALLEKLEQLGDRLQPASPAIAYGYLFSSGLLYIDGVRAADGYERFQEALRPRQVAAVGAIWSGGGLGSALDFAASVEDPYRVGAALAECNPNLDKVVLSTMRDAPVATTRFALGYFGQRFASLGWGGVDELIATHNPSAQVAADLLRSVAPRDMPWRRVDDYGPEVAAEYWDRVDYSNLGIPGKLGQLLDICQRLRRANRLGLARWLLAARADEQMSDAEFAEEVITNLECWIENSDESVGDAGRVLWELTSLLKVLDSHRESLGSSRIAVIEWHLYPILEHDPDFGAPNLYLEMSRDPELFVQFVEMAFKPALSTPADETELSEAQQKLALNAYRVLQGWPQSGFAPGKHDDRVLTADTLSAWVTTARRSFAASGRAKIGDEMIGTALASSPADPDGDWPGKAVRDLIERLDSDDIDLGLMVTVRNQRGSTVRAATAGGDQERELAAGFGLQSDRFTQWPRTAAILKSLAESYEREAKVSDREAETRRRGL